MPAWLVVVGVLAVGLPVSSGNTLAASAPPPSGATAEDQGTGPVPPTAPPPTGAAAVAPASVPQQRFQEEMVVTTSLREEEIGASTASVSVIDAAQILAQQATQASALIATVPGVSVVQSGSPGHTTSVFIRGTNSNQTLVLWNGIPLNDPLFGDFDWSFLPTEGLARIEAVRGPFSALYGSSAIGGVIQLLSGGSQGTTLRLEGGSYGYGQALVSSGYDLGSVRLDVSGHYRHGDGQFTNDFYNSGEGVVRAEWTLQPQTRLGLLVRANDSNVGIPFNGVEPSPLRRSAWQERQYAIPFDTVLGDWQLEALVSDAATSLRFRDPQDPFFSRSDIASDRLRGRAVASYGFTPGTWLSGGFEWERQQASDDDNTGINLRHLTDYNEALFSQLHASLGIARLEMGLRGDHDRRLGQRLSPNLGLALLLTRKLHLRLSYGEGFRAPALGELFFPLSGNPALKPEINRSAEVGVEYLAGAWSASLIGFENRLRNLIEFDFATFREVNVGRARTHGLEAQVRYRTRPFEVQLNGTFQRAEDLDTRLDLLRRPRRSGNLIVTWRPSARWTLNLAERYVGRRLDLDPQSFASVPNPPYNRLDLAAQWQATERLAPYARIENLADRRYSEALGFPALGRQFIGGVRLNL
jgi:vitamin B12 transporter